MRGDRAAVPNIRSVSANHLLCELHAHSTWSDGALTVTELVDLYGFHGFSRAHVIPWHLRQQAVRRRAAA